MGKTERASSSVVNLALFLSTKRISRGGKHGQNSSVNQNSENKASERRRSREGGGMTQGVTTRFPLNIFLLKEGDETEVGTDFPHSLTLDIGGEDPATLRYGSTAGQPTWLVTLSTFSVDSAGPIPEVGTASGIIQVKILGRTFCITFGHAWQKLRALRIEPNFGIRCVLNLADEDSLRAIRRDRVAEESIQAIEQIPDQDGIERFGLDVEKDLLRGVKARVSESAGFGLWVAGGDSFKATADLSKETISEFLRRTLILWSKDDYQKKFDWLDNIQPIKDNDLIGDLYSALIEQLPLSTTGFSLCAPELLSWEDFDYFSYERKKRGQAPAANHLDMDQWVAYMKGRYTTIDLDLLRKSKIYAYRADGERSDSWPVLSCINGTIENQGQTYLLHAGNWYSLSTNFVAKVNEKVESIPKAAMQLVPARLKEKEGEYNQRASVEAGLLLMDKKLLMYGGGKSRLEICDLLSEDAHLVCVKPWGGTSESLSHLFLQARHTVTLINNDEIYRSSVGEYIQKLDPKYRLTWEYLCENPKDAEVVLAIIRGCEKENLPFFAKLSLIDCHEELSKMRFRCSYAAIPIT